MWKQSFGIPKYNLSDSVLFSQRMKPANRVCHLRNFVDKRRDIISQTSSSFCLGVQWGESTHSTDLVGTTDRRQGEIRLFCASECPRHASRECSKPDFLQTKDAVCSLCHAAGCMPALPLPPLKTNFNVEGLRALWCFKPIMNYLAENRRLLI